MSSQAGKGDEDVLNRILLECIATLNQGIGLSETFQKLLELVCGYHQAERSYIFEIEKDKETLVNRYEWCAEGITSQMAKLQNIPTNAVPRWMELLTTQGEVLIESLENEVHKDSEEYRILEDQGVTSVMVAPIWVGDEWIGFLGVDNPKAYLESTVLLKSVAAFMANYIIRRRSEDMRIIDAFAGIYVSAHLFHLDEDLYEELESTHSIRTRLGYKGSISKNLEAIMNERTDPCSLENVRKFIDLTTLKQRLSQKNTINCEFLSAKDLWCRARMIVVKRDADGQAKDVIFAVEYIDEDKRREIEYQQALLEALDSENVICKEMLTLQSNGFIAVKSKTREILYCNQAAAQMFETQVEQVTGRHIDILLNRVEIKDKDQLVQTIRDIKPDKEQYGFETSLTRSDGTQFYIWVVAKRVQLQNGTVISMMSITDITNNKKMEQKLRYLSRIDGLTGLLNRGCGEKEVEDYLCMGISGMFCLFDVDKFKLINDNYGHMMGDQVLIEIAKAMQMSFRKDDILLRLGGDEFAVFAKDVTSVSAGRQLVERFFDKIREIQISGLSDFQIRLSLGAVICHSDGLKQFDEVYQQADQMMYDCKTKSEMCYRFFEEKDVGDSL